MFHCFIFLTRASALFLRLFFIRRRHVLSTFFLRAPPGCFSNFKIFYHNSHSTLTCSKHSVFTGNTKLFHNISVTNFFFSTRINKWKRSVGYTVFYLSITRLSAFTGLAKFSFIYRLITTLSI